MTRQRGMSLIVALFLIVVIALLAAFAVTVGSSQRQSNTLDMMADRALAAARSGSEWAAHRAFTGNACEASRVLALNEGALRGFRVTVECTGGPAASNAYDIRSVAEFGVYGSADYVKREVVTRFITP